MANNTLAENITQAISDFDDIKDAIEGADVEVPSGTPTSNYSNKVTEVRDIWEKLISTNYVHYNDLFHGNTWIISAPKFNHTENATTFNFMFGGCTNLLHVSLFDTSSGKNFGNMFYNCKNIESVPDFDTSDGEVFDGMFFGCNLLKSVPTLNTHSGASFKQMFQGCSQLTSISSQLDVSNGEAFAYMFASCGHITSIPDLDTHADTDFRYMFAGCLDLYTIEGLNLSNAEDVTYMFGNCESLKNITFNGVIKTASGTPLGLSYSPSLTVTSLMSCINALYDYSSSEERHTLSLGVTNLNKLSDTQKAIAINKGWTLA